ncbi:MAG: S-layer homology domain-containing protein, partial [Prevotellaceae bacterium]|nr:S-layer homology domain-containing protein [Prevotellaceae bacterium]
GVSGGEILYTQIYDGGFTDSKIIASWAKPAMYWGYYNKIISGTSATTLGPTGLATRAQIAKILVDYQDNFSK